MLRQYSASPWSSRTAVSIRKNGFVRNSSSTDFQPIRNTPFLQQLEHMRDRYLPVEEGLWDRSSVQALRTSLKSHLSLSEFLYPGQVPPGYHQVSFNHLPLEGELSHDGAEKRHAPDQDWPFRVWAGGYMEFQNPYLRMYNKKGPATVAVDEHITDARLIGNFDDANAKTIVTLTKTLFRPQLDSNLKPVQIQGRIVVGQQPDNILLREEKILCFMRQIPSSLHATEAPARQIAFPSDATYSQTMAPSPTLLFRFSALTRNAHAIHLDPAYTKEVYGISKLLVHGPLTSVLMLDVLGEALALHGIDQGHAFAVRSFQYRNLLPLFVGEQITIACKKLHDKRAEGRRFLSTLGSWEKWDVWIQRGTGKEATLAVRGSALVAPALPPTLKNDYDLLPWDEQSTGQSKT